MIDLHLGDCLEVMKQIPDKSVDAIICDLPYGTTQNKWDSVIPLDLLWDQYKRICKGAIVLTASQPFSSFLVTSNIKNFKYEWIWKKSKVTGVLNAKKQPLRQHEVVLVFYESQPTYNPQGLIACNKQTSTGVSNKGSSSNYGKITQTNDGTYTQTATGYPKSVLDIASEGKTVHPTQKPVALMEYLIKTYTNEGDTILDNCMGSGTTGIACKNLNRKFIGIEQDPSYFEIAKGRIHG
jgi:site-specific DNA-methyltransferase (adenine-specific)